LEKEMIFYDLSAIKPIAAIGTNTCKDYRNNKRQVNNHAQSQKPQHEPGRTYEYFVWKAAQQQTEIHRLPFRLQNFAKPKVASHNKTGNSVAM